MSEADYYPMGSYRDPDAPWNQTDIPEKDFNVCVSQTLSRDTTVTTNDYIPGASGVDYEPDDEGGCVASGWQDDDDTSLTDWNKVYKDCAKTPLEIIKAADIIARELMNSGTRNVGDINLLSLIKDCQGWVEDGYCVNEN